MDLSSSPKITLESGLDLREVVTTGSILHIHEHYDETDYCSEPDRSQSAAVDFIGEPITNLVELRKKLIAVDNNGLVKKKILEQGGGLPLDDICTVSVAFSGYWENVPEPFDVRTLNKPLTVDLKESGLLPGLEIAIRSMLVGELSIFMLSYQVMYGEMGIPPRIKAKMDCVFYIKLIKSVLTPNEGKINFSEPNMFQRVHREVKLLYSSGYTLYKSTNFTMAIHLFNKAVTMLHKCRLADEEEEKTQEKLLIKLYLNLAICNNKIKKPLKTCIACNELNRLNSLWHNGKALLQNAKALRMIGQYNAAEKRLQRAIRLCPDSEEVQAEIDLLEKTKESCNQTKLIVDKTVGPVQNLLSDAFKEEVDNLITNFRNNVNLCKLTLPAGLNSTEMSYIKEACIRENLFFNKIRKNYALDKDQEQTSIEEKQNELFLEDYVLDKDESIQ